MMSAHVVRTQVAGRIKNIYNALPVLFSHESQANVKEKSQKLEYEPYLCRHDVVTSRGLNNCAVVTSFSDRSVLYECRQKSFLDM